MLLFTNTIYLSVESIIHFNGFLAFLFKQEICSINSINWVFCNFDPIQIASLRFHVPYHLFLFSNFHSTQLWSINSLQVVIVLIVSLIEVHLISSILHDNVRWVWRTDGFGPLMKGIKSNNDGIKWIIEI